VRASAAEASAGGLGLAWEHTSTAIRVVVTSGALEIRGRQHPATLILSVVQPASVLLVAAFAGRGTGRVDVAAAALGSGLVALWGATVWSAGSILRRERWEGTLPRIVASSAGLGPTLLGKTLGATIRTTVLISGTVVVTAAALGHSIPIRRPVPFLAALTLVVASAVALGLLLSCLFVLSRSAPRISEALMYPVFILGGMLVPLSLLPGWVRWLSALVSLRWGAELLRAATAGAHQAWPSWLALAATTIAYAVLARLSFERVLDLARREATIDLQ
jgi:ABC-2 type transport system permease protein